MRLKDSSLKLKDLQTQTLLAVFIVNSVLEDMKFSTGMVITSLNDGKHSTNSLHYKGCAFDLRTHDYYIGTAEFESRLKALEYLRDVIKGRLTTEFDVILEDPSGPNEHIHIEYDPKITT